MIFRQISFFCSAIFQAATAFVTGPVMPEEWGEALSILKAPLGVHAVLGNHDWWHGALPGMPADDAEGVRQALRSAGIEVLENNALRVRKNGQPFWVAGLGDQMGELTARDASGVSMILAGPWRKSRTRRPSSCWRTNPLFSDAFQTAFP